MKRGGLLLAIAVLSSASAWATCYRISYAPGGVTDVNSAYYVDPAYGTTGVWSGATDTSGTSGGLPALVNINSSTFQPDGTLLASGTTDFLRSGLEQPYKPEQVLYRCTASEAGQLYEYYATNGDNDWGGMYEDGASAGMPGAYRTYAKGMLIRVTNTITGEYYSRYWKARQLTGLDVDSKGWILVKAKNFAGYKVELLRMNNSAAWTGSGMYGYSQPAAYVAFKGGGMSSGLTVGADSRYVYHGWYGDWPGAINLYNRLTVRRSATCGVTSVTPTVTFPVITAAEMNSGGSRQVPVSIKFDCQTGAPANTGLTAFASGIATNQTAMGLLVNPANAAAAVAAGVGTAGSGVSYLLSDGYGSDPTVATGVGVQISRTSGTPLKLLSTLGTLGGGNAAGWYPVLDDATAGAVVSGVTSYTKTLNAKFMALPGKTATVGRFSGQAQVIIQVQ
ncbi:fimbrial protein [Jeongeupia sp. USM3]|nr:fimbrial protein [Jeongeupia sp. USM3]